MKLDLTNADVVERFIQYELLTSKCWLVLSLVFLLIGVIILLACTIKKTNRRVLFSNVQSGLDFLFIASICIILISLIVLCIEVNDIIKCNLIPEKIISDYISNQ